MENRFVNIITGVKVLAVIFILQLILLVISIPSHQIHIDEAWSGEAAYFFAKDGYVHSTLFEGFARSEERIVLSHWLFIRIAALPIKIFGWGVGSLRLVPILAGFLLLYMLWLYCIRIENSGKRSAILACIIFLLSPLIFEYIKIYRPEILCAALGFSSFYFIRKGMNGQKSLTFLFAGLLAGLAMLTHLYGVIYIISGFVILLVYRRGRFTLLFCAFAVLAISPYIIDVLINWQLFLEQVSSPLAVKTRFSWFTPFVNLVEEHKRLFRYTDIGFSTLLFIISFIIWFQYRDKEKNILLIYTIILAALLGAIAGDKVVTRYAILLLPFFTVAIVNSVQYILNNGFQKNILRYTFVVTLLGFAGFGFYYESSCLSSHKDNLTESNSILSKDIPAGSKIIAPMNLIFNEIEHRKIVWLRLAEINCGGNYSAECMADFVRKHNAEFVVYNKFADNSEKLPENMHDKFKMYAKSDTYEIWQLK